MGFAAFARDFLINFAASAITDLSSPSGMIGSLVTLGFVLYGIVIWHRKRAAAGKRGMDSWYFIVLSGVIAISAVAALAYGIGLRSNGANNSPSQGNDTHLSLKFGPAGTTPVATELANVWRWYALASIAVGILPDGRRTEIKSWNLFMTFEKPVDVKQVLIEGHGLPQYEVKDRDSRSVVIAFLGDILDTSLSVRIDSSIGSKSPPTKGDSPAQTQSPAPLVTSLIKDPNMDWDSSGRVSLQGQFTRAGGQISIYVTYALTAGPLPQPRSVISGSSLREPRIKIGSLVHFDREERANITIGHISSVDGDQQIIQWGEPQQNSTKVGITWGSYFGSIIFVSADGREDSYPFAIIAKSQDGKPAAPVIVGPSVLSSLSGESPNSETRQ